jgi:hypothetical protein
MALEVKTNVSQAKCRSAVFVTVGHSSLAACGKCPIKRGDSETGFYAVAGFL